MRWAEAWRQIDLVRRHTVRSVLARRSFVLTLVGWGLLFVALPTFAYLRMTGSGPLASAGTELTGQVERFLLELFLTRYSLVALLMASVTLMSEAFLKEKLEGSLEALLATPVTARQAWIGKSLGLFQVGYLYSVLVTVAFVAVFTVMTGGGARPGAWAVAVFVPGVPLLSLAVFLVAGLVELTTSAARILHLTLFGAAFALLFLAGGKPGPGTAATGPELFWGFLILAAAMGAAAAVLARRLTAERVILS